MDKNELSLLCMLVDAVIDAPDQFPRVAARVQRGHQSREFGMAVDMVGATLGKVSADDREERRNALLSLAKKMAAKDRVVAGAIEWAVGNRRIMRGVA